MRVIAKIDDWMGDDFLLSLQAEISKEGEHEQADDFLTKVAHILATFGAELIPDLFLERLRNAGVEELFIQDMCVRFEKCLRHVLSDKRAKETGDER